MAFNENFVDISDEKAQLIDQTFDIVNTIKDNKDLKSDNEISKKDIVSINDQ